MGMSDKQALINAITVQLAEEYNLPIKSLKNKIAEIAQSFHVTLSNETSVTTDTSTEFLMSKFAEGKAAAGMSPCTIRQYTIAVEKLEGITGKKLIDIEPEDLSYFMQSYGQNVTSVTLRAKYQLLSSVYNYLFTHRYINYNPIHYVEVPKATVIYKKPMSDMDLERVKTVIERLPEKEAVRDTAILYTFVSTGCRVSELVNIRIKDVDFDNKVIKVLGKGRKERPVVLNDKAIYRIELYLQGRKNTNPEAPLFAHIRGDESPLTKDGVGCIIKKLRNKAGVQKITCHSFRRYYATELRKRNVNVQMIAGSLGHANLDQINRYSLYNSNEMLNTIRASI